MAPELSVSLAGLESSAESPWAAGPRAAIEWAAAAGFRSVTLDGAAPGVRARDLDRSGRRDLAALLRRRGVGFAGIDLWIPPEHLLDPARTERALGAIVGALELAGDLARLEVGTSPVVHLILPESLPRALVAEIDTGAESRRVAIADYGPRAASAGPERPRGIGVDPAAVLLAGGDPAARALEAGRSLRGARLSDADLTGRVAPGARAGRLDGAGYAAALAGAAYAGGLVLDLRGLRDQARAAAAARRWWDGVASSGS